MKQDDPIEQANAALALADRGRVQEAVSLFEDLLRAHPEMAGARSNLGALYTQSGESSRAIEHLQQCLQDLPEFPEAWNNLGNAFMQACRMEEAYRAFSKAIRLRHAYFAAHSNRFLLLRYREAKGPVLEQAVREWQSALNQHPVSKNHYEPIAPTGYKKIRLGLLSPDFRNHSIAFFLEPLLARIDRDRIVVSLYSDVRQPDSITSRLARLADCWADVRDLTDAQLLEKLRGDSLHVLIDLTGHFERNRLPVFAARAAPLQLSWLGFPGTTGTPHIDGRLVDATVAHGSSESHACEPPIVLPDGFHCYRPSANAPAIAPLPFHRNGFLTFGSFNNAAKISPAVADLWGQLLETIPDSRLLLKARAFKDPDTRKRILHGILKDRPLSPERIRFLSRRPGLTEHLRDYHEVDLALDTYPYSGTTTTCEALWMGVPVVTLTGKSPQSRVTASLLHQARLSHFITGNPTALKHLVTRLAQRPDHLVRLRSSLRAHLQKTPLLDEAAFCRNFEETLCQVSTRNHP